MQTRVARLFAFFTLTVSACAQGTHSLASDLLAVRSSVTLRKWMRAHPQDVFEGYAAAMARRSAQGNPLADSPALCGVAMGIAATLTRQAYFAVPSASSLHLPAGNRPNPELLQQCVLSGVTIESDSESPAASLANLKDDLSRVLGTGRPFEPDLADPLYWIRGAISWQGESRWILVVNTQMNGLDAVAITAANRALLTREANAPVSKAALKQAEHFANVSGMPPPLIGRMQQAIAQLESEQSIGTEQLQQIALLLVE